MFFLGVLFAFLLTQARGNPIENDMTLYEVIKTKCPDLAKFPLMEAENEFKTCKSWKEIKTVDSLAEVKIKKDDVLCLIYYNALVTYCKKNDRWNVPAPKDLSVDSNLLCKNLEVIGHDGSDESAKLREVLKNESGCKLACEVAMGYAHPTCSKAYYYLQLITPEPQALQPKPVNLSPKQQAVSHVLVNLPSANRVQSSGAASSGVASTSSKSSVKQSPDTKLADGNKDDPGLTHPADKPPVLIPAIESVAGNSEISSPAANTAQAASSAQAANSPSAVERTDVKNPAVDVPAGSEIQGQIEPSKPVAPAVKTQGQVPSPDTDPIVPPQPVKTKEPGVAEAPAAAVNGAPEQNIGDGEPESTVVKNDNKKHAEEAADISIDDDLGGAGNDEGIDQQDYQSEKESNPAAVMKPSYSEAVADSNKPEDSVSANNYQSQTVEEGDSYFFTFFMLLCVVFIVGYISYHNKQKILALILEGRRGKKQYRSRRPNSANYHKLDTNLEEAITSSTVNKNTNNVIY